VILLHMYKWGGRYGHDICLPKHQCDMYMIENLYDMCLLSVTCYSSLINTWMSYARMFWNVWQSWVVYWLNDSYMSLLSSWLAKLCMKTYILSCIRYTYHAWMGYKEMHSWYIHVVYAYGFTMVYEVLVFKQVTRKEMIDSSRDCFEKWNNLTYLKREI